MAGKLQCSKTTGRFGVCMRVWALDVAKWFRRLCRPRRPQHGSDPSAVPNAFLHPPRSETRSALNAINSSWRPRSPGCAMRTYQPHTQQHGLHPYLQRPLTANVSKRVIACSESKRRRLLDHAPRLGVWPGLSNTLLLLLLLLGTCSLSHQLQATSVQQSDVHLGDVDGHEWEVEWFDEDAEKASKVCTVTDSKEVGCAVCPECRSGRRVRMAVL